MRHPRNLTGPAMRKLLIALGIPAQHVIRKRSTGEYVADFFVPPAELEPITREHAVLPAQTYADMLREKVPGARITRLGEWKTDWRRDPAEQVRYEALVAFTLAEAEFS